MFWIAVGAFFLDRLSKIWAFGRLRPMPSGSFSLWPNILHLTYAENQGMAFGMLSGQRIFLILAPALICACGLVFLFTRGRRLPRFAQAMGWLLLGGALGNLYDRIIYGFVIDMIEIRLFQFAIFNLADSFVCVAGALLACWLLFSKEGNHARI